MTSVFTQLKDWSHNAITGNYTPSVGMLDTSIGLPVGTPITAPVSGVVLGNNLYGMYGVYGKQDWGGEIDILTNLVGYGNKVVVDVIHFDTIAPSVVPGTIVHAGQYLGTSGGQTSGGNWPSLPKYSTGPHIGVGVRSAYGWQPAWNAAPLVYQLRAGTVQSSVPTGYGSSGDQGSQGAAAGQGGQTSPGDIIQSGLIGGLLPTLVGDPRDWWAKLIAGLEKDLLGYSIRAGFVIFGALLVLVGVILFFAAHPQEEQEESQQNVDETPYIGTASQVSGSAGGTREEGGETEGVTEGGAATGMGEGAAGIGEVAAV